MDKPRYVEIYDIQNDIGDTKNPAVIHINIYIQTDSIRMKLISITFNLYSKYVQPFV